MRTVSNFGAPVEIGPKLYVSNRRADQEGENSAQGKRISSGSPESNARANRHPGERKVLEHLLLVRSIAGANDGLGCRLCTHRRKAGKWVAANVGFRIGIGGKRSGGDERGELEEYRGSGRGCGQFPARECTKKNIRSRFHFTKMDPGPGTAAVAGACHPCF